jgi:UDP-N-acetylmuramoyl-tripeptide--D-alanyl-D-alanine ligase
MGSRAIPYGLANNARVRATKIVDAGLDGVRFTVTHDEESAEASLHMLGRHNVSNALAAIAVGLESGISLADCVAAVGQLRAGDKRGQVVHWNGSTIINDSYNSNPKALDAMVDALLSVPAKRHIVIAGEMLELGPDAATLHSACGRRMAESGVSVVVGVRGNAESLVQGANALASGAVFVPSAEEAGAWMRSNLREGDAVLLKASRGVGLERALAALK